MLHTPFEPTILCTTSCGNRLKISFCVGVGVCAWVGVSFCELKNTQSNECWSSFFDLVFLSICHGHHTVGKIISVTALF